MKVLFLAFVFLYAQFAAAGKPCERLAELVKDTLDWIISDYRISLATNWQAHREFQRIRDDVLNHTGIDISSKKDLQTVSCRAFGFTKLREVYDYMNETPLSELGIPYSQVCKAYKNTIEQFEQGYIQMFDPDFVKSMKKVVYAFAIWMQRADFPQRFPVRGDHQRNVDDLNEILGMVKLQGKDGGPGNVNEVRALLTELMPIAPVKDWERQYRNQTPVEEVVAWMENSNSIFAYASLIHDNVDEWLSARALTMNQDILMVIRYNYGKVDWFEEALDIIHQSNIFKLDTSDCPEMNYQYYN